MPKPSIHPKSVLNQYYIERHRMTNALNKLFASVFMLLMSGLGHAHATASTNDSPPAERMFHVDARTYQITA